MPNLHDTIISLYERHAASYDKDRGRTLFEQAWLDRFLAHVPAGGAVLDIGCGMGQPIAAYLIVQGFRVTGIDSSPSMIDLCRGRFPAQEWLVGDMRTLALGRRFAGVLAWDSFFHLHPDDQRGMFPRFAAHALPGAPLMFTSGTGAGDAIGEYRGEPLYHGSLEPAEYEQLLASNGFSLLAHEVEDPTCGRHTIWLTKSGGREP